MKNKKRSFRLLTVALCILMFLSVVPLTAFAATYSGTCGDSGDNIAWELDEEGVLTLKGSGDMAPYVYSGEVPWNELGISSNIKSIIVGEGITSISDYAFYYCRNAASVSLPSTLKKIGAYSFYSSGLTDVTIPESVTEISNNASRALRLRRFFCPKLLQNSATAHSAAAQSSLPSIFPRALRK